MKIAYTGLSLPEGKVKYKDPVFLGLAEKFQPAKLSPYYFEFLPDDYETAHAIAIDNEHMLDLLILDMEKIEGRLSRTTDPTEKRVLETCLAQLEAEKPLCDLAPDIWDIDERAIIKTLGLLSFKPTVVLNASGLAMNGVATNGVANGSPKDLVVDSVCRDIMAKAGLMFFYTAGKQEVHAWLVQKGADAVTCAGKIHSDLARGFIKAELVNYEDMITAHSMQDARSKGLTALVDRDYIIPEQTVIEIRFNV